jgi:limonene-1,2-epoxide hydrolase
MSRHLRGDDFDRRFKRSVRNQEYFGSAVFGAIIGVATYYALQEHSMGQLVGGPYSAALLGAVGACVLRFLGRIFNK